jgi:hypothetical protein
MALIRVSRDAENVWTVNADGSGAVPITRFNESRVFNVEWTVDGAGLLLVQGDVRQEVVLLEQDGP